MSQDKLLLRVKEAAETLGYSRAFLYEAINRGEIPVVRLGKTVRVPKRWLERWIEQRVQAWEGDGERLRNNRPVRRDG
jgi:excisionase family DNA binding protein